MAQILQKRMQIVRENVIIIIIIIITIIIRILGQSVNQST